MDCRRFLGWLMAMMLPATWTYGQVVEGRDSSDVKTFDGKQLDEVFVSAYGAGRFKTKGVSNTELISSGELLRAACCNLGESFTTNPSVDVNYADAATGAQQIRLLGLSGTYVQMLTENIPNYRGAATPYSLGFIPGPWMQSIQVSKGASSVKNGYESITGQINVEFKKPQGTPFVDANLFFNTKGKLEANLGVNLHLTNRWSTALFGHYEILDKAHDGNGDGFADMPKVRQGSLMSRWAWLSDNYVFQALVKGLKEHRGRVQLPAGKQPANHNRREPRSGRGMELWRECYPKHPHRGEKTGTQCRVLLHHLPTPDAHRHGQQPTCGPFHQPRGRQLLAHLASGGHLPVVRGFYIDGNLSPHQR